MKKGCIIIESCANNRFAQHAFVAKFLLGLIFDTFAKCYCILLVKLIQRCGLFFI